MKLSIKKSFIFIIVFINAALIILLIFNNKLKSETQIINTYSCYSSFVTSGSGTVYSVIDCGPCKRTYCYSYFDSGTCHKYPNNNTKGDNNN